MHYPEYQIYEDVQSYSKHYPNKTVLIRYQTARKVRIAGFELVSGMQPQKTTQKPLETPIDDSIRRTKTTIGDIITCNEFELFCTFTFNSKYVDRENPDRVKAKMSKWLSKQRETHGKFKYLIVPEFHKDGKSIHFHALLKGYNGKLKKSEKIKNREVFNISSYRLGYSTAIPITHSHARVGNYVKKYITKDMPHFSGRKRYWCSTDLVRPVKVRNPNIDPFTLAQFVQKYNTKGMDILEREGILPVINSFKESTTWQQLISMTLSTESTSRTESPKNQKSLTASFKLH